MNSNVVTAEAAPSINFTLSKKFLLVGKFSFKNIKLEVGYAPL